MKTCTKCARELDESCFSKTKRQVDGLQRWCRECVSNYNKEWRKAHPSYRKDKSQEWWANNKHRRRGYELKKRYGVGVEWYENKLAEQSGKCALCGINTPGGRGRFHVDHDHETGEVRSLLCHNCNLMIGHAQENPELLRKAASYLEVHHV